MSITHCPHCGERIEPEVKRPDGCICDVYEWGDPHKLPPVCDKFEGHNVGQNCTRCEHDYECHAEARSNAGGNATERSEGRVDHNVGRNLEE